MLWDRYLSVCPVFNVHLAYCGQTVRWIKIKHDVEVGLGTVHIVLDGGPSSPKRGTAPTFRPMFIVAKRSPI